MAVRFTNLGAKILQVVVPDRDGLFDDVAPGYDSIEAVRRGQNSVGALIGRYAGCVGGMRFTLDGQAHQLGINSNSLHGGVKGSRFRVFGVTQVDAATCELALDYADGEEGYPGNVQSRITYQVTEDNALDIRHEATTDAPTIVNPIRHHPAHLRLCQVHLNL
jgi:aldose 1-epimerase